MGKIRRFRQPPYATMEAGKEMRLSATAALGSRRQLGRLLARENLLKAHGLGYLGQARKVDLSAPGLENRFALVAGLFRKVLTWGDGKTRVTQADRPSVVLGVASPAEELSVVAAQGFGVDSGIQGERERMEETLAKVGGFIASSCASVLVSGGRVSPRLFSGEKIEGYDWVENFRALPDGSYLLITSSGNFSKFRLGRQIAAYVLAYHAQPTPKGVLFFERVTEALEVAAFAELTSA